MSSQGPILSIVSIVLTTWTDIIDQVDDVFVVLDYGRSTVVSGSILHVQNIILHCLLGQLYFTNS